MSRGLGRWQRLLLHELYHNPLPSSVFAGNGRPRIKVARLTATTTENVAARRAARSLVGKGLAVGGRYPGSGLEQAEPPPDVVCPVCGLKCSEIGAT